MICEQNITIDSFVEKYDQLKFKGKIITNFLMNLHELKKYLERKKCELIIFDNSLFLFIPTYSFNELYYFSTSEDNLKSDLSDLLKEKLDTSKEQVHLAGVKIRQVTRNEIIEKKTV